MVLRDVENLSAGDKTMIRCRVAKGADPDVVKEQLRDIWGVTIDVTAELPAPLRELLRSWLREHGVGDGTAAALTQLAKCLDNVGVGLRRVATRRSSRSRTFRRRDSDWPIGAASDGHLEDRKALGDEGRATPVSGATAGSRHGRIALALRGHAS